MVDMIDNVAAERPFPDDLADLIKRRNNCTCPTRDDFRGPVKAAKAAGWPVSELAKAIGVTTQLVYRDYLSDRPRQS